MPMNNFIQNNNNNNFKENQSQNTEQDNKNRELIQRMEKQIADHFNSESNIKQSIIVSEKRLENLKIQIVQKEFELYKSKNKNDIKIIQKTIKTYQDEATNLQNNLNKDYNLSSESIQNRKTIQNSIKQTIKDTNNNKEISDSLNKMYKLNIMQIDNLMLQHRREINELLLQTRDYNIDKLNDQISLRNKYLNQIGTELKKKNKDLANQYLNTDNYPIAYESKAPINNIIKIENNINQMDLPKLIGKNAYNNFIEHKTQRHISDSNISKIAQQLESRLRTPSPTKQRKLYWLILGTFLYELMPNDKSKKFEIKEYKNKIKKVNPSLPRASDLTRNHSEIMQEAKLNRSFESNSSLNKSINKKPVQLQRYNFVGRYRKSPYLKGYNML